MVTAIAVVVGASVFLESDRPAKAAPKPKQESALEFQSDFAGLLRVQKKLKVTRVSCLSGGKGDYACSYVIRGNPKFECHLALVHKNLDGEVTVQHAGRVNLSVVGCGPVRKVFQVVGEGAGYGQAGNE